MLVIEVSDSSLELDQELALDYVAGQVPEYWILNMRDRQIEVYRDVVADPSSPTGYRYAFHSVMSETESLTTMTIPAVTVSAGVLLKIPRSMSNGAGQ